jgi:hypothetical protein
LYNQPNEGTSFATFAWTTDTSGNTYLETNFASTQFTYANFYGEYRLDTYTGGVTPVAMTAYFYAGQEVLGGDSFILVNLSDVSGTGTLDCTTLWDGASTALPGCTSGDLTTNGNPYKIATRGLATQTKYSFTITGLTNAQTSGPTGEHDLQIEVGGFIVNYYKVTQFVLTDFQAPTISGCPADISSTTDSGKNYSTVTWTPPTATDNLGVEGIINNFSPGDQFPVGVTTVIYTAYDASFNNDSCVFAVTVTDNQAPIFTCPSDMAVNTDPGSSVAVVSWTTPVATDNVDAVPSISISTPSGSSFPVGSHDVTYTVSDVQGNIFQCSFNVTVTDNEAPTITCPANITLNNIATTNAAPASWAFPVVGDNVGITSTIGSKNSGDSFTIGVSVVSYTTTDTSGNTATCTFEVIVLDTENPSVSCPSNIVQGTDNGVATAVVTWATPAASDNNAVVSLVPTPKTPGATFSLGITNITYTVKDAADNMGTCMFSVEVVDDENPTISCPANINQAMDTNRNYATVTWTTPTGSDNVGVISTEVTNSPGSTFLIGTHTVTYTVRDAAMNVGNCSFTVTVGDTQPPVVTCPSNVAQNTDSGQATAVVTWSPASATDNAGVGAPTPSHAIGSTFSLGATVVTYTATDVNGLTGTCTFTVTISDNENPVIPCPSDIIQNTDAGLPTAVVTWTVPVATDNVGTTGSISGTKNPLDTFNVGDTTVTYSISDTSGNVGSCSFLVRIVDAENPAVTCPPDIVQATDPGQSYANVSWTPANYSDNVAVTFLNLDHAIGSHFTLSTTTVRYTVGDAAGNQATCTFTVTVVDQESPSITCPASQILPTDTGSNARVVTWTAPSVGSGISDNIGAVASSIASSHASGSSFPLGTTTVTYSVRDAAYNNVTCSFTITILDRENPVISCPSNIVQGNDAGLTSARVTWVAPSASDNVGVAVTESTHNSNDSFPMGDTTVAFTFRDSAGNLANCTWVITVVDNEAPYVPCPSSKFVLLKSSETQSSVTWGVPVPTDNHFVKTLTSTHNPGDIFQVGNTMVTYTAYDPSGNVGNCTFIVTISDFLPNATLDNPRTGHFPTQVTIFIRPQYDVPPLGFVEVTLPGFTGFARTVCNAGWETKLPGCVENMGIGTAGNGTGIITNGNPYIIQLDGSTTLYAKETYSFGLAALTNPVTAGRTADLSVITKTPAGVPLDVNEIVPPFDIMSVVLSTTSLTVVESSSTYFTVMLDNWPGATDLTVTVKFNTSDAGEAIIVPHAVTFGFFDYNVSQTVMVYGIHDDVQDGSQPATITLSLESGDPRWTDSGLTFSDIAVTVQDIDVSGLVMNASSMVTSEYGAQDAFTVQLSSRPLHPVIVILTSSNTAEVVVAPTSLTFQPSEWNSPKTVYVTGQDELIDDGDSLNTITMQPVSFDSNYNNLTFSVNVTNVDNDVAGILTYPSNGTTYEASQIQRTAYFQMKLDTQPVGEVLVSVASDDLTEGIAFPPVLAFNSTNWNTLQTFFVHSIDDIQQDGDITYKIWLNASSSQDTVYNDVYSYVQVTNMDDDYAGLEWYPDIRTALFTTHEREGPQYTAQILQFWFHTEPLHNVTVVFTPSDPTQGYVYPSRYLVQPWQWRNQSFNVSILGRDDAVLDKDTEFTVFVTFDSLDPFYAARNYSFKAINLARTYADTGKYTKLFSLCVNEDPYTFSIPAFVSKVAAAFGWSSNQVNLDSHRACTSVDLQGVGYQDWTWVKFKPQALEGGTLVWFSFESLPNNIIIADYEAYVLDALNNNATLRALLGANGVAITVEHAKARQALEGSCPRTIRRYFGVTVEVLDTFPYSPVGAVAWGVHSDKNTNPLWVTERYAVDPVLHPHNGLKIMAEDGNVTMLVREMAERKVAGHLESYGSAWADPSKPLEATKGQKIHFGFYASPGDYLNLATKLVRSNDRFYGNDEFGARLFDADCNPQWGTDVPMYLWDAGTAQNQPFWANLNTGQDSRQLYGGSRHLGQRPEAALIRQVLDAEITNVNDTYPLPSNLLRVTIEPGVDVRLFPLINSYKGANATVEVMLPQGTSLGNEIRVEFPQGFFKFNAYYMPTVTTVLSGLDGMPVYPTTVIDGNLVKIQFDTDLVLTSRRVLLMLNNLELPPVCGELEYRVTTHSCYTRDVHNAGKYLYRVCGDAIVNMTGIPPNGMPRGCDACNACIYELTVRGNEWYTCYAPDGTPFLRVGPLEPQCAENPYTLTGYPFL